MTNRKQKSNQSILEEAADRMSISTKGILNFNSKRINDSCLPVMLKLKKTGQRHQHDKSLGNPEFQNETIEIKELHLWNNQITWRGIKLFERRQWSQLTTLALWWNNIGDKGCKFLSMIPFQSLEDLSLDSNGIEDAGVSHLSKMKGKNLKKIYLANNKITEGGVSNLNKSNWNKLEELHLNNNRMDPESLLQLLLFNCYSPTVFKLRANKDVSVNNARNIREKMRNKFPNISAHI